MINKNNAINVYSKVKELEEKYKSLEHRTLKDVELCYEDEYILNIWKDESQELNDGEGFATFEDFLIDFIEQVLQCE